MGTTIKNSLEELSYTDIYSLILFALYKLKDDPEYSTLSELVYTMHDKDSLFDFLECFGGTTIKVPTVKELKIIVNALLLYEFVNLENIPYDKAIKQIEVNDFHHKDVQEAYIKLCEILNKYSFKRN